MALSVVYDNGEYEELYISYNSVRTSHAAHAVWVTADGDELDRIKREFNGIRQAPPEFRVVTFFGDDAKFIVANWSWG